MPETIRNYLSSCGVLEQCVRILRDTEDDDGMISEFLGVISAMIVTSTFFLFCNMSLFR